MNEQRFFVGERVRVRRYGEIDALDIGTANYDDFYCYGIPKRRVDLMSGEPDGYIIRSGRWNEDRGMFIYELSNPHTGITEAYYWAQGMLCPYDEECAELPEPDPEDLSLFFACG